MLHQTGAKKVNFEPKGSGMGAPCQADLSCYPRRREKAGQQSGTVAPCQFSASRLIPWAHCNLGITQFFLSSSLSKMATSGFL